MVCTIWIGQPTGQTLSTSTERIGQRNHLTHHKPERIDIMRGVIGSAPTSHIHRRVNHKLARTSAYHLQQEPQLVTPSSVLDDIQPKDDRSRLLEWCIDGHSVISSLRLCGEFGRDSGFVGF
ncbi:hypothetical protein [Streptomyces sp. NPDC058872]|uniref:hypothetical protein n=1 Tax=Streptomyces sp. NPDC058872 TaxID=3346661 RepID=UPI00369D9ACF